MSKQSGAHKLGFVLGAAIIGSVWLGCETLANLWRKREPVAARSVIADA